MHSIAKIIFSGTLLITASCGRNVFDSAESTDSDELTKASAALESNNPDKALGIITGMMPAAAQNIVANGDPSAADYSTQLSDSMASVPNGSQILALYTTATMQKNGIDVLSLATKLSGGSSSSSLALVEDASDTPLCQLTSISQKLPANTIYRIFALAKASVTVTQKNGGAVAKGQALVLTMTAALKLTRLMSEIDTEKDGMLTTDEIALLGDLTIVVGSNTLKVGDELYATAQDVVDSVVFFREASGDQAEGQKPGAVTKALNKLNTEADKIQNPEGAAEGISNVEKLKLYLSGKVANKKCF